MFWPSTAWASFTVPDHVSVDMGSMGTLTLMIVSTLAVVWVLRKLIKFINRS